MPVRCELYQLGSRGYLVPHIAQNTKIHQGWSITTSSEADEHFWGSETAVVEVCWETCGRAVDELVVIRHVLPQPGEDDRDVGDGVLVVAGLEVHLEAVLVQLLLLVRWG